MARSLNVTTTLRNLILCALMFAGPAFAEGLRDPMRPAGAPAAARPMAVYSLKLEGVIAGEKRVAIINGRLVRAGDTIAGARILEVLARGVRYERAGKVQILNLAVTPANIGVRVARSRPEEVRPKETRQ
jgi:hypothetical protein